MRLTLIFLILIIIAGCANQVTPTGGAKDIKPPTPLSYSPDSNSIHFTATEIIIQFDEYIQLNDVFNQIIISPPLDVVPEYKVKGKTLTIKLNSTLKEATTYTVNFGQAIKDNTEGNILENFTYVFSTGDYIDSLQISGKVTDLLTAAPAAKTFVVLYLNPTDTSFTTSTPYYFTKTDASGNFIIRNIRSGAYKLYAIEDKNFNYYYDLPNEKIAFQSTSIVIDSNLTNQQLQLFSENKSAQNLLEAKSNRYSQVKLAFAINTANTTINYIGTDTSTLYISHNKTNDTLNIWKSNYLLDSILLNIQFDTTVINKAIELKSFPSDSNFYKSINAFTTNVTALGKGSDANTRADWDPAKPIRLNFYNPIANITDIIPTVYKDSTPINANIIIDTLDARNVYIQYDWQPSTLYDIIIQNKSFKDIFGLYNTADTIKIQTKKIDAYATLTTTIKQTTPQNLIFQLLKFDLTIVEEKYISREAFENASSSFAIKQMYLIPGVYKIRVIYDSDGNGKWTPGNLEQNLLPESVYFFPVDQNLRANWDNEIDWDLK